MYKSDSTKRSTPWRIGSKQPRFTSVDFYIPPGGPDIDVPIRGRAVQLQAVLDYNLRGQAAHVVTCQDTWEGFIDADVAPWVQPVGNLNPPASDTVTYVAGDMMFTLTTVVPLPAAVLTLGPFNVLGNANPSGNPTVMQVPAGIVLNFPGGPAGIYPLAVPGVVATINPASPPDLTFTAGPAGVNLVPYTAVAVLVSTCQHPAIAPALAINKGCVGYVHLNRVENHQIVPPLGIPGGDGHQTIQAIPIPATPAGVIRVEQEFDWIRIESASTIVVPFACAGVLIVEHETEQEVR